MKKAPGDIILYMCTINDNHIYDVCFLRHGVRRTEFFIILDDFLPFCPPNNPKNQNFEKMEKTPGDIILHKCTKKHDHMLHCSWDMACDRYNFHFSFWAIFCPFTPLTTQEIKLLKREKNASKYHHCSHVFQKLWSHDVWFLRYGVQQMIGQTEGWKKWHIVVGAPPKN